MCVFCTFLYFRWDIRLFPERREAEKNVFGASCILNLFHSVVRCCLHCLFLLSYSVSSYVASLIPLTVLMHSFQTSLRERERKWIHLIFILVFHSSKIQLLEVLRNWKLLSLSLSVSLVVLRNGLMDCFISFPVI